MQKKKSHSGICTIPGDVVGIAACVNSPSLDLVNMVALEITCLSYDLYSVPYFKIWDGGAGRGREATIHCLGPKSWRHFHISTHPMSAHKKEDEEVRSTMCFPLSMSVFYCCVNRPSPEARITEPCLHSPCLLCIKAPAEQFLFTILTLLLSISTEDIKREDGLCSWMRAIWLSISREWQIPSDVVSRWAFSEAGFVCRRLFSLHTRPREAILS